MQQGANYNPNPYDSQDYESPPLQYIPYAASQPDMPSSPSPDALPHDESPRYDHPSSYTMAPGETPGMPPMPPDQFLGPIPSSPRKKRQRRPWIVLGVIVLVLIVGGTASFALFTYLNRSTPTKTLDTFCNALQKEDYHTAYSQFSPNLQTHFSEQDFTNVLRPDKVATCTHGTTSESGTTTTTSLKLVHASHGVNNDSVTLRKDSNNLWKIDDLQGA